MKNERVRWLALWVVTVVTSWWLGSKLTNDESADEDASAAAEAARRGGEAMRAELSGRGVERGLSAEELRALMRDELARAEGQRLRADGRRDATVAGDATDDEVDDAEDGDGVGADGDGDGDGTNAARGLGAAPPPSREEKVRRVNDALAVVQGAVASGQWRGEERQRFAAAVQRLPAAELFEVTRQLNIAINRGQVAIPDGRPPYGPLALLP